MLPEMVEDEDEKTSRQEYARLVVNPQGVMKAQGQWEQGEKENRAGAGLNPETGMDVDEGTSSGVRANYPGTVRGLTRTDTEEVFN
jgi:hypothetical protein